MSRKYVGPKSEEVARELETTDSSLKDLSYEQAYDVPADFFRSQKASILKDATESKVKTPTISAKILSLWKPISGVAVALTIGLIMITGEGNNEMVVASIDEIEESTLEDYLLDQAEYLDSDIVATYDLNDEID